MNFLGPDGVSDRIAQIQSRLDSFSPRANPPGSNSRASFGQALDTALNAPLDPMAMTLNPVAGTIGGQSGLQSSDLQSMADQAADRYGVDRTLFRALVKQESGWDSKATSRAGAKGLCQLMDPTAREMGVSDVYDPAQSLDGGARYLRRMLDMNHGDETRALASYNAGFGRVNGRAMAYWPAETQQYVTRILSIAKSDQV